MTGDVNLQRRQLWVVLIVILIIECNFFLIQVWLLTLSEVNCGFDDERNIFWEQILRQRCFSYDIEILKRHNSVDIRSHIESDQSDYVVQGASDAFLSEIQFSRLGLICYVTCFDDQQVISKAKRSRCVSVLYSDPIFMNFFESVSVAIVVGMRCFLFWYVLIRHAPLWTRVTSWSDCREFSFVGFMRFSTSGITS